MAHVRVWDRPTGVWPQAIGAECFYSGDMRRIRVSPVGDLVGPYRGLGPTVGVQTHDPSCRAIPPTGHVATSVRRLVTLSDGPRL